MVAGSAAKCYLDASRSSETSTLMMPLWLASCAKSPSSRRAFHRSVPFTGRFHLCCPRKLFVPLPFSNSSPSFDMLKLELLPTSLPPFFLFDFLTVRECGRPCWSCSFNCVAKSRGSPSFASALIPGITAAWQGALRAGPTPRCVGPLETSFSCREQGPDRHPSPQKPGSEPQKPHLLQQEEKPHNGKKNVESSPTVCSWTARNGTQQVVQCTPSPTNVWVSELRLCSTRTNESLEAVPRGWSSEGHEVIQANFLAPKISGHQKILAIISGCF